MLMCSRIDCSWLKNESISTWRCSKDIRRSPVRRGFSKKLHRPWQGPFKVVKVLGPSIYRIVDCANPRRRKVVHFNRLKPAPSHSTAEEEDEYYDVIVHSVPPADTDRQATILEVPRQHQLEHPVPKIEQPAVVPRVPPPAVEGAPALTG
eukprot:Em0002g1137a